jgi:hypothetical protein
VARGKHKRSNAERRTAARQLARFWYLELAKEGAIQYGASGQRRTVEIEPALSRRRRLRAELGSDPTYWRRPARVTADGVETRDPHEAGSSRGATSRVHIVETSAGRRYIPIHDDTHPARLAYAREAMRHVAAMSLEARAVLEMDAAGWDWPAIREELGDCSEQLAREFLAEGLGHLMSYQALRKPSWVTAAD